MTATDTRRELVRTLSLHQTARDAELAADAIDARIRAIVGEYDAAPKATEPAWSIAPRPASPAPADPPTLDLRRIAAEHPAESTVLAATDPPAQDGEGPVCPWRGCHTRVDVADTACPAHAELDAAYQEGYRDGERAMTAQRDEARRFWARSQREEAIAQREALAAYKQRDAAIKERDEALVKVRAWEDGEERRAAACMRHEDAANAERDAARAQVEAMRTALVAAKRVVNPATNENTAYLIDAALACLDTGRQEDKL